MNLASPIAFAWVALWLGACLCAWALARHRRAALDRLLAPDLRRQLLRNHLPALPVLRWVLVSLAALLVITALARPRWGHVWMESSRRGVDILVLLDTSKSMLASDIKPNRLQRAKWGVQDLLGRLQGDRIGLVPFAGDSFLHCPLTPDYAAFRMHLDDVSPDMIPRGGTNLKGALGTALETFQKDKTKSEKVVVLISDGEDLEEGVAEARDKLRAEGVRIYSIGVGTPEGELLPGKDGGFMKNPQGEVIQSRLNENLLREISDLYVRSNAVDFGLERVYDRGIQALQDQELATRRVKQYNERFQWFLAAALLVLVLDAFARVPLRWATNRRRATP